MFSRRYVTACLLHFMLVTYIFPHGNQALKCRVENDEKTENKFHDVVRACMSNNYGNNQHHQEHNSDHNHGHNWQKKSNNRGSTHYSHGDRDYHQDYEGEDDEPEYRNPNNYNRHHRHRRTNSKLFFNQRLNRTNNNHNNQNNNKNANNNRGNPSSIEDIDACIVQCIFQQMKMLNDEGQPDMSSVTRVMTQHIRDPDLKEFIQDAVTECFEITNPDNERGKCEFSKSLALCLEQRGQQNCEDWDEKPERNKSFKSNNNNSKHGNSYPDMHRG